MAEELQAGAVLAGRYRVDRLVGRGGMGSVWAALDQTTGQPVALKLLRAALLGNDDLRRRFLVEIRVASTIDHPAVVPFVELFELDDHTPVSVMELLDGETLARRLRRQELLAVDQTLRILSPVAAALAAAHGQDIVHRDLKPENIFLARGPGGEVTTKVLDFGVAKLLDPGRAGSVITRAGTTLGTPCYMAPEQAAADPSIDRRADIWSLGVVSYECLSGVRPVEVTSVGQLIKRVATQAITPLELLAPATPPALGALVRRMLSPNRDDRPADMAVVLETFERLAPG